MVRTERRTDRRTDTEGYNIIPRHTLVAGYKKEGAVFDRHKKSICSKRRSYQYLLGDCIYGFKCFFNEMVYFLT